jgi:hypothetical protein
LNIDAKRDILVTLLRKLEPRRADIKSICRKKYDEMIFSMANNLHIRHNNIEGKNRKAVVANMTNRQLSSKYDDLYILIKIVTNLLSDKSFYEHYAEYNRIESEYKELAKELKDSQNKLPNI